MSRVVYSDTPATLDQERLRVSHGVRIVNLVEEGTGVNSLPEGTYGFTYSPALPNAPLFAQRHFRSYETHKVAGGEVFIIGFVTPEMSLAMSSAREDVTITLQPQPDSDSTTLVAVPYSRIRQHRQYASPNQHGFVVTLLPLL
jgi:hypothetical protein